MKELRNILIFSNKLDKLGFNTHADLLDKLSEFRISSFKFKKNAQQSENISEVQDECCDKLREVFTLLNIENKEEFLSCLEDVTRCVNDPSKLQALMRSCDSIVEKFFDEEHYEQTFEDDKYKFEEEYHDEHMHEKPMPKVSSKKKSLNKVSQLHVMGEVFDFLWNKRVIERKSILSYILDFENFKRNSEILGWAKENRLSFKERFPEIKDKITYSFLFFINQEKKNKKTFDIYDFIKIFVDFTAKIVEQFPVFRGDDSSFYDRVVNVVERFTPLVSEIVDKINAADVLITEPAKRLSNNEILNSNFRISVNNVNEFLNVVNRSNVLYHANILFFDLKNPFNDQNPEGISLLKKTLDLSKSISFAKNASEASSLEKYLVRLKKEMDEASEKEFTLFKKEGENKEACARRIIRQLIESNIFVDDEVKSYLLSKFGISSEIDSDLDIKMAGQVPAGMHNFILNTGLFGESNYDELEWIRRESDKTIKEYEKNLKKIRLSK